MAFPGTPSDGDRYRSGGRNYEYDLASNSWLLLEDGDHVTIIADVAASGTLTSNVKVAFIDGSGGAVAVSLPASPRDGQEMILKAVNIDNEVKINSTSIEGMSGDYIFTSVGDTLVLVYSSSSTTWHIVNETNALYPNPREPTHSVFEDMANSLIGRTLSSSAGKVDYNWDNNSITMQPGGVMATTNDRIIWNNQLPHGSKLNTSIYPHVHWEQINTNQIEWRLAYRVQKHGAAKTTAWTEIVCDSVNDSAFTYVSGTLNQITAFPSIDMTGAGISAVVQFRLVREDVTADDIEVTFVDSHVELDSDGSREQYVK